MFIIENALNQIASHSQIVNTLVLLADHSDKDQRNINNTLEAKLWINQVAVISINKAMNSPISQDQYQNMLKVVTLLCSEQENIYIFRNLIHSEMALMENSNPSVAQLNQYLSNSTFWYGIALVVSSNIEIQKHSWLQ